MTVFGIPCPPGTVIVMGLLVVCASCPELTTIIFTPGWFMPALTGPAPDVYVAWPNNETHVKALTHTLSLS